MKNGRNKRQKHFGKNRNSPYRRCGDPTTAYANSKTECATTDIRKHKLRSQNQMGNKLQFRRGRTLRIRSARPLRASHRLKRLYGRRGVHPHRARFARHLPKRGIRMSKIQRCALYWNRAEFLNRKEDRQKRKRLGLNREITSGKIKKAVPFFDITLYLSIWEYGEDQPSSKCCNLCRVPV